MRPDDATAIACNSVSMCLPTNASKDSSNSLDRAQDVPLETLLSKKPPNLSTPPNHEGAGDFMQTKNQQPQPPLPLAFLVLQLGSIECWTVEETPGLKTRTPPAKTQTCMARSP